MVRPIIIDCDTGRDDAVAIALALASPDELKILGVTVVAGNVSLGCAHKNTRFICDLCGFPQMMVFAGAEKPLKRALVTAERAHGESGLGGLDRPDLPELPPTGHAVEFMADTLRASGANSVTIVATGPLTNIALLVTNHTGLLEHIREIVVMGGASAEAGNVSPVAEFNFHVDPEAASIVLNCRRPISIISLDVTYQVLGGRKQHQMLQQCKSRIANFLAPAFLPIDQSTRNRLGKHAVAMHDPCTIAYLLRPELFRMKSVFVDVETKSQLTMAQTVVDFWNIREQPANALWADRVDGPAVIDLIVERLSKLP